MLSYLALYFLMVILGVTCNYDNNQLKKNIFNPSWLLAFIVLTLFIGFRYQVGADWNAYQEQVEMMAGEEYSFLYRDPAYSTLNWFGANVGGNIYFVNLVCSIIFCWSLIKFCHSQPRSWLALIHSLPYLVIVVGMGYSRQAVAIGFWLLTILCLSNKNIYKAFFFIICASLFHKSAIVLSVIIILSLDWKKNKSITYLFSFIFFIVGFQFFLDGYDILMTQYVTPEYRSSGSFVRISINGFSALLFLLNRKKYTTNPIELRFWTTMSWLAILAFILLLLTPSSTAVDRFSLYLIPLQLFVLSRFPDALSLNECAKIILIYGIVFSNFIFLLVWQEYSNYSFLWQPYKFFPFEFYMEY
ncbi:EpsG family protein [Polynucleobacter sp. JS-Mosq-20-D10]|uniref:EpsG family protein n=1 Tax=Polynucleobacter sp. JS-Mosq-20-D10 TaxID=2576922 RepID=UPI00203AC84E|nr:EpsG family protein [Polynucleobacter sp. JS-Mosq-20-D10]